MGPINNLKCLLSGLMVFLLGLNANAQSCGTAMSTYTFDGAGSSNEAVFNSGSTSARSTHNTCGGDITIDISVRNPDNVYYTGSSTNGSLGQPGYEVWLDNNDNLFDSDPLSPGESVYIDYDFSQPIQVYNFKICDLDARGYGISASWQDEVTVTAEDADGNNVPMTISTSASSSRLTISGQTATAVWVDGEDRGLGVMDADGIAMWTSTAPVSKITVQYAAGPDDPDAGQQVIRMDGFSFCCPAVILPMELTAFEVEQEMNGEVTIDWTTMDEQAIFKFEIEHSSNGQDWNTIASIDARGGNEETNYRYIHSSPETASNYYRLVEISPSGERTPYQVRSIYIDLSTQIQIGPNPAIANGTINLNGIEGKHTFELIDLTGRLVQQGETNGTIELDGKAGMHFLRIIDANGRLIQSTSVQLI